MEYDLGKIAFYQVFGAVAVDSLIPLKAFSSRPIYSLPSNLVFASFYLLFGFVIPHCRITWVYLLCLFVGILY